jgi:outer membrane protein assembly factor BamB
MIYVAGYARAEAPPPGYASAEGFWQACLLEVDAQGQVTRRLAGTVSREQPEVWVELSPWGAAYAVDELGGIYGLLPAGRSRFNDAGVRLAGPISVGHRGQLFAGGPGGVRGLELEADEPVSLVYSTGSSYASAPALGPDGSLYFNSSSGGRLLAASASGDLLWQRRAQGARPVLGADGLVYLASGTQLSVLATSGEAIWEFSVETPLGRAAPAPAPDGSVYVVTLSGLVYSVERGQKRWSFPLERPIRSELSVDASGTVYAADELGKVYAIGADGQKRWTLQLPTPSGTPVPGPDGTVYVADAAGKLHAITPPGGG